MKKKILVLALAVAVIAVAAIGGTLAWLTSTPNAVTNTFTVGELEIKLAEPKWDPNEAKIVPAAEIDKDPTVTVTKGNEKCYVFVKVDVDPEISAVLATNGIDYNTTNWTLVPSQTNVYYKVVDATAKTAESDTVLPAIFTKVLIKEDANNAAIAAAANKNIVVTAYAIQFDGFADAATAWAEF